VIDWKTISLKDLAGYLSAELQKKGIEIVLVGGACVTIYSKNRYQSYDLDFVVYEDMKQVKQALKEVGFTEKNGYFRHDECKWIVEFVTSPVAIGKQIIVDFQHFKTPVGTIKMLRAEDSVKDRLASYFYWNDRQGLEQAIDIYREHKINLKEIESWATDEGFLAKFYEFVQKIGANPDRI
jgi:hypothetical protein